jgi:hypothetical protein
MSNKSLKSSSMRRLFLICPTDNLEQVISNDFEGETFFCTALGGYFEFDLKTQSNVWDLICENDINQIVFVIGINNVFFKHAFEKKVKHNYRVDEALSKTKKKIFKHLMYLEVFSSNFHLLAAHHLANQKKTITVYSLFGKSFKKRKDFRKNLCIST